MSETLLYLIAFGLILIDFALLAVYARR